MFLEFLPFVFWRIFHLQLRLCEMMRKHWAEEDTNDLDEAPTLFKSKISLKVSWILIFSLKFKSCKVCLFTFFLKTIRNLFFWKSLNLSTLQLCTWRVTSFSFHYFCLHLSHYNAHNFWHLQLSQYLSCFIY